MQHITNIEIKNFKSIRQAEIRDCRRVNVFIGYPNVGKSNILEALGLYSVIQQRNQERFSFSSICRLSHLSDIFFDKNMQNKLSIRLNNEFDLSLRQKQSDSDFRIEVKSDENNQADFFTNIGTESNFKIFSAGINNDNANFYSHIPNVKYYHFDERLTDFSKKKSFALSIPNGDNLLDILQGNSPLRKLYNDYLKGYGLRLNISENEIAIAKELKDGTFVSFKQNNVADTLRRLFFYVAAIETNKNAVLLLEEPEAHCYEPYIMEITNAIKNDENNNQFFIVTHSQYVIQELLRDKESRDDVNIYLVGLDDNNETKVKLLTPEVSEEIYKSGLNIFFNFENLWDEN